MVDKLHHNYKILVNDKDVTASIKPHFVSLELTDNDADDADQLTLTISSKFKRPSYNDVIKTYLGWGNSLKFAGLFFVQQSIIRNNRQLIIKATGADFNGDLKVRRHQSYEESTLGSVAAKVAARHSLEIKTNVAKSTEYGMRFEQINESDLHFMNRLSKQHNIIFNVKNNTLYFMKKGSEVPTVKVDINTCIDSEITYSNTTKYNSCKAIYQNTKLNKISSVVVGEGKPVLIKQGKWIDDNEALIAAKNALTRANKDEVDGNLSKIGEVIFSGSKLELDNDFYDIKKVTQTISKGWKTQIEFKNVTT